MMNSLGSVYPRRALIRYKAKVQILAGFNETGCSCSGIDEELLKEFLSTLLQSEKAQVLYSSCNSQDALDEVEETLARELATHYEQVKLQQDDPLVQSLNALL